MRRSITFISASQRSCSAPRLSSSIGSTARERSTIRDNRLAQTLRKAPMPLSRNTGATASRTISATVVTDKSACGSATIALRIAVPLATSDLQQQQPVDDEARGENPGEARDQRRRRPEQADDDRGDRKAGDEQGGKHEVHTRGQGHPGPD